MPRRIEIVNDRPDLSLQGALGLGFDVIDNRTGNGFLDGDEDPLIFRLLDRTGPARREHAGKPQKPCTDSCSQPDSAARNKIRPGSNHVFSPKSAVSPDRQPNYTSSPFA